MYFRRPQGWLKHWDFMLIDVLCLHFSFVLAFYIRHGHWDYWKNETYITVAVAMAIASVAVAFFSETFKNVFKRSIYRELLQTIKQNGFVFLLTVFFLYFAKIGQEVSRLTISNCACFYLITSFFTRILYKKLLLSHMNKSGSKNLLIIAPSKDAELIVDRIQKHNYDFYKIVGISLIDDSDREGDISGVPIVCAYDKVAEYVCRNWIDEVIFFGELSINNRSIIEKLFETGVTVHISVSALTNFGNRKILFEHVSGQAVITTSIHYVTATQIFLSRMLDIVLGLIGSLMAVLLTVIIGPVIFFSSPGNIFFTQERIGKNGKHFKIIKFRTMYPNADADKSKYLSQNRNSDGMMFKLDFDPRIIGNRITSDGKQKTGIGQFMRSHSIDEFPQFFNVLMGHMSIVGTRPPTLDEWEKYDLHHRARLTIRPGITGLWQVSGRSNITDFEKVVKLDRYYIMHWTLGRDIKIIIKTILVVFKGNGAK